MPFLNDQERWNAVLSHDSSADGSFLYAVKTTGVYCLPSCGSRRPQRRNVEFFPSAADAEQAGFRPCLRCHPAETRDSVAQACRLIESSDNELSLDELAAAAGLSRFHFHRLFKRQTGLTPKAYADEHRAQKIRKQLSEKATVTEAIYDSGFNSAGRFYESSRDLLGMTPTQFRNGGAGMKIRFAVGQSSLGSVLVAATDKGVCAIMLGDEPDALLKEFQSRFHRAELVGGDQAFEDWVASVVGIVENPKLGLKLPLDVRGTAFQRRVWQELRRIPYGSTATYTEVAQRIGAPKSVRAVAHACASNPVAIAIPCHRVVRTGGDLAGYRWGLERKRDLLAREAAH